SRPDAPAEPLAFIGKMSFERKTASALKMFFKADWCWWPERLTPTASSVDRPTMLPIILLVFVLGYLAIALEHKLHINKAATALFIGVVCWSLYAIDVQNLLPENRVPEWFQLEQRTGESAGSVHEQDSADHADHHGNASLSQHYLVDGQLLHLTGEIAGILFFLIGAMTIVELVDAHEGFELITSRIKARKESTLLWILCWLAFFLSAVLDNLTTTIVMVSLLRKLIHDHQKRLFFVGMVVIAANAGGAWTVIGDVTTTMLWIKGKISAVEVMNELLLPSIACLLVPLLLISRNMTGTLQDSPQKHHHVDKNILPWQQKLFLILGILGLVSVPVFKTYTHLPPFMGMMLSLSLLWIVSELISHTKDESTRTSTGLLSVLKRIDMSSVLFFLGILLAVGALSAVGTLGQLARWLDQTIPSREVVAVIIGLLSAVVDNVPLVAAGMEMYSMPIDHPFWMLLAYCAGTGGSCLIIGSAAGVAAMGLEHIDFVWYLKKIGPWALLGYLAGMLVYLAQSWLLG
ncbi:MAG: sodium:proton antiporter NhaD, partial [Pirellulaceae bacterium]